MKTLFFFFFFFIYFFFGGMKTLDLPHSKCKVQSVSINKGNLISLSVLLGIVSKSRDNQILVLPIDVP